jgi:hypothetical protein
MIFVFLMTPFSLWASSNPALHGRQDRPGIDSEIALILWIGSDKAPFIHI